MKVKYCDYGGLQIEMTRGEFLIITGVTVGDQYGNGGISHGQIAGKEYSLTPLDKQLGELKNIKKTFPYLIEKIDYIKTLLGTIEAFGPAPLKVKDD